MTPQLSAKEVDVSIVIPTYNERENILLLIDQLEEVLKGMSMQVIVVDDQSPDGTGEQVACYVKQRPWLQVIHRKEKPSLSGSVVDGLRLARGQVLCVMDADLSHDPILVPKMIEWVGKGTEFVIGSRRVRGGGAQEWPWFRWVLSSLGNWLARALLKVPIKDTMSGYFAMDRQFYATAKDLVYPRGYKIMLEFCVRGRPRSIQELGYVFRNRKQGYSKLNRSVAIAYLVMLWDLCLYTWFKERRSR